MSPDHSPHLEAHLDCGLHSSIEQVVQKPTRVGVLSFERLIDLHLAAVDLADRWSVAGGHELPQ